MRIKYDSALALLKSVLLSKGFSETDAELSSRLFCDANRDGIQSHGLARFGNYVAAIDDGRVIPENTPRKTWTGGALERWSGRSGPGNLNAWRSMQRAMDLASEHGLGCVALSETNHWMRGGNFGWQAADAGCAAICWTNTMPNLPPWGSEHPLVGNNPLILAVPGNDDRHIVLDMAMSQFSWGALGQYSDRGEVLPVPGGYDSEGKLSHDAAAVIDSGRPLPAGFWKGSGLALLLDMMAALLSGGKATRDISPDPGSETGISQVFIAFAPPANPGLVEGILESLEAYGENIRYPGRETIRRRQESDRLGIPVDGIIWENIRAMETGRVS